MPDPCEEGTCSRCGQTMLRTASDAWHPYTVKEACPPEIDKDGVTVPEWGGYGRPGREYFVPATETTPTEIR